MTTIGGWWLSSLELDPGEALLHKYPTNYFGGDDRPYGGRLYVTDRRLVFLPHRIDAVLGASRVSIPFRELNDISSETDFLTNAEREDRRIPVRLRVETLDGTVHLFIVDDLDNVLVQVQEAVGIPESDTEAVS